MANKLLNTLCVISLFSFFVTPAFVFATKDGERPSKRRRTEEVSEEINISFLELPALNTREHPFFTPTQLADVIAILTFTLARRNSTAAAFTEEQQRIVTEFSQWLSTQHYLS